MGFKGKGVLFIFSRGGQPLVSSPSQPKASRMVTKFTGEVRRLRIRGGDKQGAISDHLVEWRSVYSEYNDWGKGKSPDRQRSPDTP